MNKLFMLTRDVKSKMMKSALCVCDVGRVQNGATTDAGNARKINTPKKRRRGRTTARSDDEKN